MSKGSYGVDAPGLVRVFLIVGLVSGAVGWALSKSFYPSSWVTLVVAVLWFLSLCGFGMFSYMLWGSLITKVRGRDALLDLIPWTGREQVLDVGCGRGLMLVAAAHRLRAGHAIGIDLWLARDQSSNESAAPLENARREGVRERVSVQTSDMRELPFPDASFDVVLSHWVVHNLELQSERATALAEMARVLRPGGTLLLTDIACRNEYQLELACLGLSDLRLVIQSQLRDSINRLVSFGSFQPATLIAVKK